MRSRLLRGVLLLALVSAGTLALLVPPASSATAQIKPRGADEKKKFEELASKVVEKAEKAYAAQGRIVKLAKTPVAAFEDLKKITGMRARTPALLTRIKAQAKLDLPSEDEIRGSWDARAEIVKKVPGKALYVGNQTLSPLESCGSCWSFAGVGAYEANFLYQGTFGDKVEVSEQHILNCADPLPGQFGPEEITCDTGAFTDTALKHLREQGAAARSAVSYVARKETCDQAVAKTYRAAGFGLVHTVNQNLIPDKSILQRHLLKYGALVVGLTATRRFQLSPIRDDTVFQEFTDERPNHAVVLLGWNEEKKAWLIKNSWGTGWGNNGYMWVRYGAINIGTEAAWVQAAGVKKDPDKKPDDKPCPTKPGTKPRTTRERLDWWLANYPEYARD